MGAQRVIGIEVDAHHAEWLVGWGVMILMPDMSTSSEPWRASSDLIKRVKAATNGLGVDVAFEMVGVNSALNNAIQMTRRGGHVVLFGVRNGDVVIEDYHRLVMNGIQLHGVVGRRIFDTWEITRALLEDDSNGIQEAIYNVILNQGKGTIVSIEDWNKSDFEQTIASYPKPIIRFV